MMHVCLKLLSTNKSVFSRSRCFKTLLFPVANFVCLAQYPVLIDTVFIVCLWTGREMITRKSVGSYTCFSSSLLFGFCLTGFSFSRGGRNMSFYYIKKNKIK